MELFLIIFAVLIIGYVFYRGKKLGYFDKKEHAEAGAVLEQSLTLAGTYTGRIDMPEKAVRIAAKARALSIGENKTGGGVDGGYYLDGAFGFEADSSGAVIKGEFIVHGTRFATDGGKVNQDGSFSFTASHLPVRGNVIGTSIVGRVSEPGRDWVYGNIAGTFTAGAKL